MQALTGTVGQSGVNAISDVAIVQAILLKTQRAAAPGRAVGPYLTSYDGTAGPGTIAAINAFQADHLTTSGGLNTGVTAGQVGPGDATWTAMLARVDTAFADMRTMAGGKIVFVAATGAELQVKIRALGTKTFTTGFRAKVSATINSMFTLHGVAIGVCPQGDRRDFQTQYDLLNSGRNVTNAGPGESNHNFGMAVDLGFRGLRWLRADGTVVTDETDWLHRLDTVGGGQSAKFWAAMRAAGIAAGAFRGPVGDLPHLQNWSDAGVSMTGRLPPHLTASGTMRWGRGAGHYTCDLGYGGALTAVGTASQIWNRAATVTAAGIQQLHAVAARAPRGPGQPLLPPAPDVAAMRQLLRGEFELADANWANWTP